MTGPGIDSDVLVVGAGPVGLTLALWLRRFGHAVTLVDRSKGGSEHSKALGIHAPTMETFDALGVGHRFVAEGKPVRAFRVYGDGAQIADLRFDVVDSPHQYVMSLPQARTEAILRDALAEVGGEVRWERELVALDRFSGFCVARFADGAQSVHKWVVGCDGATSKVRETLGIEFGGHRFDEWFVLADVRIDWAEAPDEVRLFLGSSGLLLLIPLPGERRYRLVAPLADWTSDDRPPHGEAAIRAVADVRSPLTMELSDFTWTSAFRIRSRLADRYREGRVFLAGDAAHTHSPVGGQGMNMGIADATNLAWKLDLVLRGTWPDEFLDTYEAERRPVARQIVVGTDVATRLGTSASPLLGVFRNQIASFATAFDVVREGVTHQATMTATAYGGRLFGTSYPDLLHTEMGVDHTTEAPSISQRLDFARAPGSGGRAPDVEVAPGTRLWGGVDPLRHTLLLFVGEGNASDACDTITSACTAIRARYASALECVVVARGTLPEALRSAADRLVADPDLRAHHRYGAESAAAYFVRPDRHIAWRAQPMRLDAFEQFVERVYGWHTAE